MSLRWGVLCFLMRFSMACTAPWLSQAESAYDQGRYENAAEELARHEKEVANLSDSERARYGLCRGLALMKLGDHNGARRWLGQARDASGALDDARERELESAWTELAKKGLVAGHHEMPIR
jgi:hypothetical protein